MSSLDTIAYVNGEAADAQNSSWSALSLRVLNPVLLKKIKNTFRVYLMDEP